MLSYSKIVISLVYGRSFMLILEYMFCGTQQWLQVRNAYVRTYLHTYIDVSTVQVRIIPKHTLCLNIKSYHTLALALVFFCFFFIEKRLRQRSLKLPYQGFSTPTFQESNLGFQPHISDYIPKFYIIVSTSCWGTSTFTFNYCGNTAEVFQYSWRY